MDFDDPFVIEILDSWDDDEDGIATLDDDFTGMTQSEDKLPSALQIHDRYVGRIKMQLYLYIDPRHPKDMHVATPFPNVPRLFFDKILNASQVEELQETVQFAREMMDERAELDDTERKNDDKASIEDVRRCEDGSPEENGSWLEEPSPELEKILIDDVSEEEESVADEAETSLQAIGVVRLIKVHSDLFSEEFYEPFKKEIEKLALDYDNLTVHHVSVYDQFCLHCGTLLEALTRYLVQSVDKEERKASARVIQDSAFDVQVADILQELGQTGCDGLVHTNPNNVAQALRGRNNHSGSAKELMIGLALDAVTHEREARKAFQAHPSLVQEMFTIYNQRNENAHFNEKDAEEQKEKERVATDVYERITQLSDVLIQAYLRPHVTKNEIYDKVRNSYV